jgi:hypothetical protein
MNILRLLLTQLFITQLNAFSNISLGHQKVGLSRNQFHYQHGPSESKSALRLGDVEMSYFDGPPVAAFVVLAAAILGIGSQTLISSMLDGDQGLRAFLSDGSGFNKSKFSPNKKDDSTNSSPSDPLPWLRLPKLDFVEVAGQDQSAEIEKELEFLAARVRSEMSRGETEKASETMKELDSLMEEYGFDYSAQNEK